MGNRRAREFMLRQAENSEWQKVRSEPRPATHDVLARGIGWRRLQLIVAPSIQPASAWEVRQGELWRLIRSQVVETWPDTVLLGYEPIPFESSALAAYFDRVTALTLPLRPDLSGCGGCDGTLYEFAVYGDLYSGWRFHWWSTWPEQWQPLVELVMEIQAAFASASGRHDEAITEPGTPRE